MHQIIKKIVYSDYLKFKVVGNYVIAYTDYAIMGESEIAKIYVSKDYSKYDSLLFNTTLHKILFPQSIFIDILQYNWKENIMLALKDVEISLKYTVFIKDVRIYKITNGEYRVEIRAIKNGQPEGITAIVGDENEAQEFCSRFIEKYEKDLLLS